MQHMIILVSSCSSPPPARLLLLLLVSSLLSSRSCLVVPVSFVPFLCCCLWCVYFCDPHFQARNVVMKRGFSELDPSQGKLTVKYSGQSGTPSDNLYISGLPSPQIDQASLHEMFTGLGLTVVRSRVIPDTKGWGLCDVSGTSCHFPQQDTPPTVPSWESFFGFSFLLSPLPTLSPLPLSPPSPRKCHCSLQRLMREQCPFNRVVWKWSCGWPPLLLEAMPAHTVCTLEVH